MPQTCPKVAIDGGAASNRHQSRPDSMYSLPIGASTRAYARHEHKQQQVVAARRPSSKQRKGEFFMAVLVSYRPLASPFEQLKITSSDYYRHRFASAFFSTLTSSSC